MKRKISAEQRAQLIATLKARFEKNMNRHKSLAWSRVEAKLKTTEKLWSLYEMERTGGEPDVVTTGSGSKDNFIFFDCSAESPAGRRSMCYDHEALEARKEHKPENSAVQMAADIGVALLTEEQYRELQNFGQFDTRTSSWIQTPAGIRKLGGALFCDRRYETVFLYHNGAESYYAARGFRSSLRI